MTENKKLIDTHIHITANKDYTPAGYLGVRLPFNYLFLRGLEAVLQFFGWMFKSEKLKNYKGFVEYFNLSSKDLLIKLKNKDLEPTIHCALLMDMSKIKGRQKKNNFEQLQEISDMRKTDKDLLVFAAIEPNQSNDYRVQMLELIKKSKVDGIKIYPCLGYLPSHPYLMNVIYPYCMENDIPIVAHCSRAVTHASSKKIRIKGIDINGNVIDEVRKFSNQESYRQLNDPKGWIPVLEKFPYLRLNLAHFGGNEFDKYNTNKRSWVTDIIGLIIKYPNVYTDISYTFSNQHYLDAIIKLLETNEKISDKVLYGTDYFMVLMEGSYRDLLTKFHTKLGDKWLDKLGRENPRKFLKIR